MVLTITANGVIVNQHSKDEVIMTKNIKHLYRSTTNCKIAGVCGGLGEYFNVDPSIMRLLYILVILFSVGFGIIAYLVMWVVIPSEPTSITVEHEDDPKTKK